jgi:cysteinyl-tRNA synthetase
VGRGGARGRAAAVARAALAAAIVLGAVLAAWPAARGTAAAALEQAGGGRVMLPLIPGKPTPGDAATPSPVVPGGPTALPARRPWSAVNSFAYWLDGPGLDQLAASGFELVVIDYSSDGSAGGEFTAAQIAGLRAGCDRRALAYLSIGQAEDYRFYWNSAWATSAPSWLVGEDPEWPGNYFVRYWDPGWQALIHAYLDRIIAQGFDGIYLDRVDAYQESYASGRERDMVDFVLDLARYARARSPLGDDFGVFVQNAEDLGSRHADYVAEVTGIGREEVYVAATNRPTSAAERASTERALDVFRERSRGHLVLTVDYADRADLVAQAYSASRARGFVPYVSDVGLNRMRVNPGQEPTCRPAGA